jgi:hypothetical protein
MLVRLKFYENTLSDYQNQKGNRQFVAHPQGVKLLIAAMQLPHPARSPGGD